MLRGYGASIGWVTFTSCLFLTACNRETIESTGDDSVSPAADLADPSLGGVPADREPVDSVGDVTTGPLGGDGRPVTPLVRARIRNESDARADVTLRFIQDEAVVHLAFARVLPDTVTTVVSPKPAERIELSGINEQGRALPSRTLSFGAEFGLSVTAEYVIHVEGGAAGGEPTGDPSGDDVEDPPPVVPAPVEFDPPTITLLEPAQDITLTLGSTFAARWTDTNEAPGAVVVISMRSAATGGQTAVGPAVGASLDGINDELDVVVQRLEPGLYNVVAAIDDGTNSTASIAPGLVRVVMDPSNAAPTLTIVSPLSLVEVGLGEQLEIEWTDHDPDDNATVTFALIPADADDLGVGAFPIGPFLAENPDGLADRMRVAVQDVLPGEYDLLGTIDDGELIGTARVESAVMVRPAVQNESPQIVLLEPSVEITVKIGQSFLVRWTDSDANDNARISLLLEPDLVTLERDGDEILLVASLGEDEEGPGDSVTLGIPASGVATGDYRLVGIITDGLSELLVAAPGMLHVVPADPDEPAIEEPPLPSVLLLEPMETVRTRMGGSFYIRLQHSNVPPGSQFVLFLDNERFGGDVHAELSPPGFNLEQNISSVEIYLELILPAALENLPNHAWPRSFDFGVSVVVGGVTYSSTAPAVVWIRREVELQTAEMINYTCSPSGGTSGQGAPFIGLEFSWYGGGFGDGVETLDPVSFWLSRDGAIPADGQNDGTHRLIHGTSLESPNTSVLTSVGFVDAFGVEYIRMGNYDLIQMQLEPGEYQLVPQVVDTPFGPLTSPAHPDPISVCYPLPAPDIAAQP